MITLLALATLSGADPALAAKPPPPPTGELLLDMADPVIELSIGKVPLRLRVGLEQKNIIELNPAAADRLAANPPDKNFRFERGFDAWIGREKLEGIETAAPITINKRKLLVLVASHGRDCCAGVDGEIGLGLLPYATIRFVRAGMADPGRSAEFLLDDSSERGPQTTIAVGSTPIFLQFSFDRIDSVATSSAGVILARTYGGGITAKGGSTISAFGIKRPTETLTLKRPVDLAGFRFNQLPVRVADFAGKFSFPYDPDEPGDIVVQKRTKQQDAWPVVLIGRDRMDRCAEALYDTIARKLTLRCTFGGGS